MTRRHFLAGAAAASLRAAPAKRPNIVLFMTDDHGAWATGAYGCPSIHTPNVDRLAATGVRFTNAFAATPVCSPSRMTYMTGTLPSHHHVQDWLLPEDSSGPASPRWLQGLRTYAEVLAESGYTLGMCGKWHMGRDEVAQAGFSYWATVPGGGGTYRSPEFVVNGERRKVEGFKTDLQTDYALDFLDRHHAKPFYLHVPFYAPHTPYDFQPEADRALHANSDFACFPSDVPKHPWQNRSLANNYGNRNSKLAYSALVSGMDRNIGRVLDKLDQLGVRDNTLIIFTADQGWNAGHHGMWGKGNGTVPFNMYEESIRVPLVWNQPGAIAAGTVDAMVSSYDFFPTILDYLGLRAPADRRRVGMSYAPWIRGQHPRWRTRLFFEYAYVRSIRTQNLKYVERTDGYPSEFFDLEADPREARNVLSDAGYAAGARALGAELSKFFKDAGAPPIADWRKTTTQKLPPN